jgi:hypothetical protein
VTKATSSNWEKTEKPSPQLWCLEARMKAPAGSRALPRASIRMPAKIRIACTIRRT